MRERLHIDPKRVGVDLDHTLFTFIGESERTNTIESANLINKTLDLLLLLEARRYHLSIYTAAFFYRPAYIAEYHPEIYGLFKEVFTRESLVNNDAPIDSDIHLRRAQLMRSQPDKWRSIEIPEFGLTPADHVTIQWVGKNRGKVPALISAATMLDDGRKVRQLGGPDTRVQIIKPNQIPNSDTAIRGFVQANFK